MSAATAMTPVRFAVSEPYDLALSLRAAASFARGRADPEETAEEALRSPVRIGDVATLLEIREAATEPMMLEAVPGPRLRPKPC